MAHDTHEFARKINELREQHGESKQDAAIRIGIGLRQYNRWTSSHPPEARLENVRKVADAYDLDLADLLDVDRGEGTISDRLGALADLAAEGARAVARIEQLLDQRLPALDAQQTPPTRTPRQAPQPDAQTTRAKRPPRTA